VLLKVDSPKNPEVFEIYIRTKKEPQNIHGNTVNFETNTNREHGSFSRGILERPERQSQTSISEHLHLRSRGFRDI